MCLIVFAFDAHPKYSLILAANRDEFYARPTLVADYWRDNPNILGGRDQKAGGTWMALHKHGRFAAVTNYRDLKNIRDDARSRGDLPVNFLSGNQSPQEYLSDMHAEAGEYNGFNLLTYDGSRMGHYSNYEGKVNVLEPGIYGLSNALLNTPWPKVEKLKSEFSKVIADDFAHDDLLNLLTDSTRADDAQLPDTGVGFDLEKMLSAICIKSENYGTCCSTVLTIEKSGKVEFTERTYPVGNRVEGQVTFELGLPS